MTNLDARMGQLREMMEEKYLCGEKEEALALSRRLDKLIALAQRTGLMGETRLYAQGKECDFPPLTY